MILSQIAAMSENRVIGKDNDLPWHIPADLKYFKNKTKGRVIIMGRKTFESLGTGHPLPGRLNVIVTRNPEFKAEGVHVFTDIDKAIDFSESKIGEWPDEVFVCGGSEIYKQTLGKVNRIYLTVIHNKYEGDTFFPDFDEDEFEVISREDHNDPEPYSFMVYERKK